MISQIKEIVNRLNTLKYYLLTANILLVISLITLTNFGVLPLKNTGDFLFFTALAFMLALYRPGWSFLFFIGTIALENIDLAPKEIDLTIRPYQLLGLATFLAVGVRYFTRRLNFKLPKIEWTEYALVLFVLGGFLGSLNAYNSGLAIKQSIIIVSFALLYFLVRIFIRDLDDIKRTIPFFLSSSFVVVLYAIWQNWRFIQGRNHFEVMPGRANATFTEADWLGMFLVLLLTILYVVAYNFYSKMKILKLSYKTYMFGYSCFVWVMIVLSWMALIITVARSAWLGAGVVTLGTAIYLLVKKKIKLSLMFMGAILLAIGLVYIFGITNFQLSNRALSTASGEQEITIACKGEVQIPGPLDNVSQLMQYDCQHINLEDVEKEKSAGKIIKKIYRKDPNVSIRKEIYSKSINEIKNNFIFGIGWGNISDVLGKDERGAGLNSSNIFLEVWLGAGILGLASLITLLGYILVRGKVFFLKKLREGKFWREDSTMDFFHLFLVLGAVAIIIPNLFNAGIMLGFLWVWMGVAFVKN
ncbi:MAG: O-antigen ligase family protein [Candidatus Moraniibacteriota bacterium]